MSAAIVALVSGTIGATVSYVLCEYFFLSSSTKSIEYALSSGTSFALVLSLPVGGNTCIQHLLLRAVLFLNGSIPFNVHLFLEMMVKFKLLKRSASGGQYVFTHSLLRSYISKISLTKR